jgi:PIN domain nuclease of toxin-antitoxin system
MNLLLDTHIALWSVTGNSKRRPDIVQTIANPKNTSFISVASIWEIAIRFARNKGLLDDYARIRDPGAGYIQECRISVSEN